MTTIHTIQVHKYSTRKKKNIWEIICWKIFALKNHKHATRYIHYLLTPFLPQKLDQEFMISPLCTDVQNLPPSFSSHSMYMECGSLMYIHYTVYIFGQ